MITLSSAQIKSNLTLEDAAIRVAKGSTSLFSWPRGPEQKQSFTGVTGQYE